MFKDTLNNLAISDSAKAKAINAILANENDCGRYGKALEIYFKSATNNKVAGHDKTDKKMLVKTENGKKFAKVEIKTNGGRIDDIIGNDYIIYAMDICNSTTKGKRRVCEPVIMKADTFMAILNECNAIKKVNKGGMVDGHAIQVSNKAFYETMRDYPTKFELGKVYNENEIA